MSGTVTYRERVALTPRAAVEITLEDVSRADASANVLARMRLESPGQPPIKFELPYDASRIDARRRYAVRAQIFEAVRLVFTTSAPVFVLTQGRGAQVSLVLNAVTGAGGFDTPTPSMPPVPQSGPIAALPPAVDLRNLPATFVGTGGGSRYQLNLFPDESYFLHAGRLLGRGASGDEIGSWTLSSDRRLLVLRGSGGSTSTFSIRDQTTLRRVDGNEPGDGVARVAELRRTAYTPLDLRLPMTGVYRSIGESGQFTECLTGQRWAVAPGNELQAIDRGGPRHAIGRDAGGVLITVDGRLSSRRSGAAGSSAPVLEVERVIRTDPRGTCEPRFTATPLTNTIWRLTMLGAERVTAATPSAQPTLTFRDAPRAFSGSGGCNRIAGAYQVVGDTMGLRSAGTLMACPDGTDIERRFRAALDQTRAYRIVGSTLELYDARRQLVARFEG